MSTKSKDRKREMEKEKGSNILGRMFTITTLNTKKLLCLYSYIYYIVYCSGGGSDRAAYLFVIYIKTLRPNSNTNTFVVITNNLRH